MTRINCVPVKELSKKHCFAEYREMARLRHAWPRHSPPNIPKKYCLGKGHCTFFYDKGIYLIKRHKLLFKRCVEYFGFDIKNIPLLTLNHWPNHAMNDWKPTKEAISINRKRIKERSK